MFNFIKDIPGDYLNENQPITAGVEMTSAEYLLLLSDIEIAYRYTVIQVQGLRPSHYALKLPGTLYSYIPDQRPITEQHIGKPSSGPSPPGKQVFCSLTEPCPVQKKNLLTI
jgi:hypothetical protein